MIRRFLSRCVCFFLGHIIVAREAVWYQQRAFLPPTVEAICIRCWRHRVTFTVDLCQNLFTESPVMKKLKGNK